MFEYNNKIKILIIGVISTILLIGVIIYFFIENKNDNQYFEFNELCEDKLENTVENVIENVIIEEKIVVHISGEVINPGVITLKDGSRVVDAIDMAGGVTQNADLSKINLAYILEDAQKVHIPSKDEENTVEEITSQSNSINKEKNLIININTANEKELQNLPGIGESIAKRIINYRKENGKFNSIEDIKNVSGIGESKFNKIKNNISIK